MSGAERMLSALAGEYRLGMGTANALSDIDNMVLSKSAKVLDRRNGTCDTGGIVPDPAPSMTPSSLGSTLQEARKARGLSLREVERQTGVNNAHISQIESGSIQRPEMSILFELAHVYGLDFADLLAQAGYSEGRESSGRQRQRLTVAMRTMGQLTPKQQSDVLSYMASLRRREQP